MLAKAGCLIAAVSLYLFFASSAAAQTTFGSIMGTVTDPSGAVVPGAAVTVTNAGTGAIRRVTTNPSGVFNVPDLELGSYRVGVAAKGFATYERTALRLIARQVINLNVALVLGNTATVTQVTAAAPVIDTTDATISSVVTGNSMEDLPMVTRRRTDSGIFDMILLNTGGYQTPDNGSGPIIHGAPQAAAQTLTINGIALVRNTSGFGAGEEQPSFDFVQEESLTTADAPAEFATPSAVTQVTKSGTNQFHGSLFEDHSSNGLDARDFFAPTIAHSVFNEFGVDLGGPIKKNKVFFFFVFDGSRVGSDQLLVASVPLPAWRNGDFSNLLSQGITVTNPFSGVPFANNQIPQNLISSVSQKTQNLYPEPNYGPAGTLSNNFRENVPYIGPLTWDKYNARVDYNLSPRDAISGSFNKVMAPQYYTDDLPSIGHVTQTRYGLASYFSWTHTFAPNLVNEFRAGYVRGRYVYYPTLIGSDLIQQLGIQGVTASNIHDVPIFDITGVTSIDMDAAGDSYEDHLEQSYEFMDNIAWTKGRHLMKFGFDAIRDQMLHSNISSSVYGQYSFPGVYTGFGYSDFLLGVPQTSNLSVPTPNAYLLGTMWGLYAQDEFKVTPKLTLNYGVRWDITPPYHEENGEIYNFDTQNGDLVVPQNGLSRISPLYPKNVPVINASQADYPANALLNSPYDRIVPRFGFAFTPSQNGKTVIRGGYGIYTNLVYSNVVQSLIGGPFSGEATYINAINNGVPLFSFPDPFLPAGTVSTEDVEGMNPNFNLPYTQQWNFTVERQFGGIGLRASYVGTHTVDMLYQSNLNQPAPSLTPFSVSERAYPLYDTVTWIDSGGSDDYNDFELSGEKTYGNNLTFSSGYTYEKDLTDVGNSDTTTGDLVQNRFDLEADQGNNIDTPTQRLFAYALYKLPVGHDQRFLSNAKPVAQALLGGWTMMWSGLIQTGEFFTPSFAGFDPSNTDTFGGRPDVVPGVSTRPPGGPSINEWFNPAAFEIPGCPDANPVCANPANVGQFGNAGVGILEGPTQHNLDFTLMKTFPIKERYQLQFRVNVVNLLNHPNFYNPDGDISDIGTVATISSTTNVNGFGEPTSREIDFWLRLNF
jgi:Carboxypeptidase regulatory-like domain/TonB dependent receptor